MDFRKNSKGITLIALIITIIVLLILAGVSLSLIGEDGIISKTITSSKKMKVEQLTEMLLLEKGELHIEKISGTLKLEDYINLLKDKNIISDIYEKVEENAVNILLEDEYLFLIEEIANNDLKIEYQGELGALESINGLIADTTETANSVKIIGRSKEAEKGIIAYGWTISETEPSGTTTTTDEFGKWTTISKTTAQIKKEKTVTSNGTYYFWIKDGSDNITYSSVVVNNIVPKVTSITNYYYSPTTVVVGNTGPTPTLEYAGTPKSISYFCDNPEILTIDESTGAVTGVKAGQAILLVTITNYDGTTVKATVTSTVLDSLATAVNVGDYVAYDATNSYQYESPTGSGTSHGNGDSNQKFTSSSNIKWRVLSKDESTGEVVLISEQPILSDAGDYFYLYGAVGYLYVEQELSNICAIYGHGYGADTGKTFYYKVGDIIEEEEKCVTGSGARSLNIEDINKIAGYNPTIFDGYGTVTTQTMFYPTMTTETGYSTSAGTRTYENTCYRYNFEEYLDKTTPIYKMLFRNLDDSNNIEYWLASRAGGYQVSNSIYFQIRAVINSATNIWGADLGCGSQYMFSNTSKGKRSAVRPIVYLKPTLQTYGTDDNGAWKLH